MSSVQTVELTGRNRESKDKKQKKNVRLDFRDLKIDNNTEELVLALVGKFHKLGVKCEFLEDELENKNEVLAQKQELEDRSQRHEVQIKGLKNQITEKDKALAKLQCKLETVQKTVVQRGVEIKRLKRKSQRKSDIIKRNFQLKPGVEK
ncbi:unnamed protein product [Orchesella dallaii]|uniref:Uncharacterized protein n=1 Tax=Orchesella dallaii TaxID=48710 RepID=A0ABP1RMX5_9HEXA